MTDDQHRDQGQTPASEDGSGSLDSPDVQQAQERSGIAGEPQPTDTGAEDEYEEPTSPPGYGGA